MVHSKSWKISAAVSALFLALTVMLSAFYVAAEAEHDCSGNNCPVCACIQNCERTLHDVKEGSGGQTAELLRLTAMTGECGFQQVLTAQSTPVSRKVRLND